MREGLFALVFLSISRPGAGAELEHVTLAAYERHVANFGEQFARQIEGDLFLEVDEAAGRELRSGIVIARPGSEDGIISVDEGLIHHWRGAIFIPDATLADVLAVAQDFGAYDEIYDWIVDARLLEHRQNGRSDNYRVLLRIERSAGPVTGVVDLWTAVSYRYPRAGRAAALSDADCIRQVENPGSPDEYRLPPDTGSGYLWRANTFSKYLERDGGVYVQVDNIGLSRGFPPLLGWLIEPFARRLGRGSVTESLVRLRNAVADTSGTRSQEGAASSRLPSPAPRSNGPQECGSGPAEARFPFAAPGGLTSTRSTRLPSMSTTSKRNPPRSNTSPVRGTRPSASIASPPAV